MIYYKKANGTSGTFDSDKLYHLEAKEHVFTITLKYYGWDEYDFWYEEIPDIIEITID